MKLPQIPQRTPTAPLRTVDPYEYTRAAAAVGNALNTTARSLARIGQEYQQREQKSQLSQADTQFQVEGNAFDIEHAGQIEYDNTAIPEPLKNTYDIQGEGITPRYVVHADWRNEHYAKLVDKHSQIIKDPALRQQWVDQKTKFVSNQYTKDMIERASEQQMHILKKGEIEVTELENMREYDAARQKVATLPLSKEAIAIAQKKITANEQTTYLIDSIVPDPDLTPEHQVEMYQMILDKLVVDDEQFVGALDETKRKAWIEEYSRLVRQHTSQLGARVKGQDAYTKYKIRESIKVMERGEALDPVQKAQLEDYLNQYAATDENGMVLRTQWDMADAVGEFRNRVFSRRIPYGLTMPARQTEADPLTRQLIKKQRDVIQEEQTLWENDPIAFIAKYQGSPLSKLDFRNLPESLEQRFQDWQAADAHYGQAPKHFFSEEEAKLFEGTLEELQPEEIVDFSSTVNQAFDGEHARFWDQIQASGVAGPVAFAGQMVVENKKDIAVEIMKGYRMQKDDPRILNRDQIRDIEDIIDEAIPGAYKLSTQSASVRQAATALAYYHQQRFGDHDPDTIRDLVTGGIITYKSANLLSPKGLTENQFETWVEDLSPTNFSSILAKGQFEGQTEENIGQYVKDSVTGMFSHIKLDQTPYRGKYYLYNERTRQFLREKNGQTFVLEYKEEARKTIDDDTAKELDRLLKFEQPELKNEGIKQQSDKMLENMRKSFLSDKG